MGYLANEKRYDDMVYNRTGRSGLMLPAIALGLWHNFGHEDTYENMRNMLMTAFDLGITHFDLANNYGTLGVAEENFGRIFEQDFKPYRDEMIISTKAGFRMWPGPYGEFGSRKYILASLDQSLSRMGLDYVDIFYSHRFDPNTPLEETMWALGDAVKQGKALYIGVCRYPVEALKECARLGREMRVPLLIHQPRYSMLDRTIEEGALATCEEEGIGTITFSSLAQGLLTNKYLNGIPADSRAAKPSGFLKEKAVTEALVNKVKLLSKIAEARGQTMAQMALSWVLRDPRVTSAIIGASRPSQIIDCAKAKDNTKFTDEELNKIEEILK